MRSTCTATTTSMHSMSQVSSDWLSKLTNQIHFNSNYHIIVQIQNRHSIYFFLSIEMSRNLCSMDLIVIIVVLISHSIVNGLTMSSDSFARNKPFFDNSYISPDHVVLSAAVCKASCYHKCLQMQANSSENSNQMQQDSTIAHSPASVIEQQCKKFNQEFTTSCTTGCEYSGGNGGAGVKDCTNQCQPNSSGCLEGCQFLNTAIKMSLGNCPDKIEIDKLLDRECHLDQQCMIEGDVRKCCNLRCVVPKFHSKIGPNLWPPTIMEGKDGSSFEMTWKYDDTSFSEPLLPILYVLQVRTYFNKDFETTKASNWKTLLITFREGVNLQDLQPGMWYQFRVASVTKHGTNGFKSFSPPVKLAKTPASPGVPRNLTDGAWRIRANGKINIRVHWMEPASFDIPVTEYKISWVRDHGFTQPDGQSLEALTDFVQTVPGNQRSYDIEGLMADKTYKVQVRAICKWGSAALISTPNTIFLTTPQLPVRESERVVSKDSSSLSGGHCNCVDGPQDARIKISKPYYHKNSLKIDLFITNSKKDLVYKISYAPNVCIDTESSSLFVNDLQPSPSDINEIYRERGITAALPNATLGPLQFSCRYTIQVQPLRIRPNKRKIRREVNSDDEQFLLTSCFCTPSCLKLISEPQYQSTNLRCLNRAHPILEPPNKILYQRSQKNPESFLVFWEYREKSDILLLPNVRFRVIWGPSIDDHVDHKFMQPGVNQLLLPRIDMSQAETKVLKENVSSIWLENLKKNTFYIVQVQAIFYQQEMEQISKTKLIILSTHKDQSFPKLSVSNHHQQVLIQNNANARHGSSVAVLMLLLSIFSWRLET